MQPQAPDPDADAVDRLAVAVVKLSRAYRRAGRKAVEQSHGELLLPLLELVYELGDGEHRLGELAALRGVGQSAVSRQICELQARALVSRRADPSDRRASLVRLTPAGRGLRERLVRTRRQWLQGALVRCPEQDVSSVTELVDRITEELDAHLPELIQAAEPAPWRGTTAP